MAEIKLTISPEGARACRDYAKAMKDANGSITDATAKLEGVFRGLSESLGYHEEQFHSIISTVKAAQGMASEAIEVLPPKLEATAGRIDAYCAEHPTVGGGSGN